MGSLARIFDYSGYKVVSTSFSSRESAVFIELERSECKDFTCYRCGSSLGRFRGKYRCKAEDLTVMGHRVFTRYWRHKGHCSKCNKARTESIDFVSKQTPHMTSRLSEWVGRLCEMACESNVADLCGQSKMTVLRVDIERLKELLKHYKIPPVTHISVDEVYARKKSKHKHESRDDRFFTVITDLNTRRVIYVAEGRQKGALDSFFSLIGKKSCKKIKVVACDQHEAYRASVTQNCPNAKVVWDRFHIMQSINEAVNEQRKQLHGEYNAKDHKTEFLLSRGKYRFIFLKKDSRRSKSEKDHLARLIQENGEFSLLEMIKELMHIFYDQMDEEEAKLVLEQACTFAYQAKFKTLSDVLNRLYRNWSTLKNYFQFRVSSAISEGINNVIKVLKRKAYGYRNMLHFRLKIMQQCGYLNSKFIDPESGENKHLGMLQNNKLKYLAF